MNKYVRTKNSIREIINDYGNSCDVKSKHGKSIDSFTTVYGLKFAPRADSIEDLCDEFVRIVSSGRKSLVKHYEIAIEEKLKFKEKLTYYGAIWTDKGLKYVAKVNEEGELELLRNTLEQRVAR